MPSIYHELDAYREMYDREDILDFMRSYRLFDLAEEFESPEMDEGKEHRVYKYYDIIQTKQCDYCKRHVAIKNGNNAAATKICWICRLICDLVKVQNAEKRIPINPASGPIHDLMLVIRNTTPRSLEELKQKKEATLGQWYHKCVNDGREPDPADDHPANDGDGGGGNDGDDEDDANMDAKYPIGNQQEDVVMPNGRALRNLPARQAARAEARHAGVRRPPSPSEDEPPLRRQRRSGQDVAPAVIDLEDG